MKKKNKFSNKYSIGLALIYFVINSLLLSSCTVRQVITPAQTTLDPWPAHTAPSLPGPDPLREQQWYLDKINANSFNDVAEYSNNTSTHSIKVAIISTGVDYNHEDLASNIDINQAEWSHRIENPFMPLDNIDNDQNNYVDDIVGWDVIGHDGLAFDTLGDGTAAAGLIGAIAQNKLGIKGIANHVSIVPIRYIDHEGSTNIFHLVDALKYAQVAHVDLILLQLPNISLLGKKADEIKIGTKMLENALLPFSASQIPIVVAAGNSGLDLSQKNSILKILKKSDNILVVTTSDQADQKPFIANWGPDYVDIAAPGVDIISTFPGNQYQKISGNLASAALVTGSIALAMSQNNRSNNAPELIKKLLSEEGCDTLQQFALFVSSSCRLNVGKFMASLK